MIFYTLLHISESERSTHNNRANGFINQIKVYIDCIKLLQESLLLENIQLELLTNDYNFLNQIIEKPFINIIELDFKLHVPSGAKFYSAHFKLEVYKFLSTCQSNYVGLIDNDIICINKMPDCFKNCIDDQIPLYYDLSNQVFPAYGQAKILAEKNKISISNRVGIWAGGEFIAGSPHFFSQLYAEVLNISDVYFQNIKSFHHQGDEFLTSVALENCLLKQGTLALDAGTLNIIGRYWGFPIRHEQRSFSEFKKCFLLHIPSNKKFLSRVSNKGLSRNQLIRSLQKELTLNIPINYLKLFIQRALKTFDFIKNKRLTKFF